MEYLKHKTSHQPKAEINPGKLLNNLNFNKVLKN